MSKITGRSCLLKIGDGVIPTFTAFAGLTAKSLKINNGRIDVTTPDATTPEGAIWTASLDGVKSISISGDGQLTKDASEVRLLSMAMAQAAEDEFELLFPNVGTFAGKFSIEVELSAGDDATFSISLESNGEITFTPAA